MDLTMRNLSLVFVAGCWGGLWEQPGGMARRISRDRPGSRGPDRPSVNPGFRLCQAGCGAAFGGLLFLLPLGRWSFPARGLLFSLAPTLVQLCLVFPVMAHKGVLGLQLGYPHSPPGGVLQCHLGVWGGLVVKLGGDE